MPAEHLNGANASMKPVLYGILNALFPGLAYVILRRRQVFGVLILVSTIAVVASAFFEPTEASFWESLFSATTQEGKIFEAIAIIATALAFGYDAYTLAKEN